MADTAIVVVDLGFGDAGKGATVDWLCAPATGLDVAAVVRSNGGAQAAHNVVADGRAHTFAQFGSGTLSGVRTFLSRHMLVEPIALAREAGQLAWLGIADPLSLIDIDENALLTTPIQVAANRTREQARGADRHGSCGLGIGETAWYALEYPDLAPTVGDCRTPRILRRKLEALAAHYGPLLATGRNRHPGLDELLTLYQEFAAAVRILSADRLAELATGGRLVFEGAQGVLLDEWRGFHPHTTSSTVEPSGARRLLDEIGCPSYVLGVTRTYMTRHGEGPLPSADPVLEAVLTEAHNRSNGFQGRFRSGHFDPILLRYAIAACGGIDGVAVTHVDAVEKCADIASVAAYRTEHGVCHELPLGQWQDLDHQVRLTAMVSGASVELESIDRRCVPAFGERVLGVPVVVTADGPQRAARATVRSTQPVTA